MKLANQDFASEREPRLDLSRLVMVDFPRGVLGWGGLAFFGFSAIFTLRLVLSGIWKKVRDPEWRRLSDWWSWVAIGLGSVAVVLLAGYALVVVGVNVAWHMTH